MSDEINDVAMLEAPPASVTMVPTVRNTMAGASLLLDRDAMAGLYKLATIMAQGGVSVPGHFRGKDKVADCLAVCMQASQWNMNPFAVAQKTHIVNGALGYEAQLVNAVVLQSGLIEGRFHYEYKGTMPGSYECRVGAKIKGEAEITWNEWISEKTITVKNSPLWKTNPKQQLGYLQVKNWARLYTPGAILGVYTPDELVEARPPRNMGNASMVVPDPSEDLLARAEAAAAKGSKTYAEFWANCTPEERRTLFATHRARQEAAAAADQARTVDNGAEPEPARTEPMFTTDKVRGFLNEAKDIDELNAAADLINHLTNPDDVKELSALFDRRNDEFNK